MSFDQLRDYDNKPVLLYRGEGDEIREYFKQILKDDVLVLYPTDPKKDR